MFNSETEAAIVLKSQIRRRLSALLLLAASLSGAAACRRDMQDQPKYEIYERSEFFNDKQTQRPIPEGTVARGYLRDDDHLYTGKISAGGGAAANSRTAALSTGAGNPNTQVANREDGSAAGDLVPSPGSVATQSDPNNVDTFPFPVTREVLDRGQERYEVFCMMCHGLTGDGDGMVVRRGFKRPTSYHDERLRGERVGHFFDVITNGWGSMPNYAAQITPRDRWAITAYIRALQLSRAPRMEDLSEQERQRLMQGINADQPQSETEGERRP